MRWTWHRSREEGQRRDSSRACWAESLVRLASDDILTLMLLQLKLG
jgi:hypothetical protein